MTCEVVVANRWGLAMAADSAVSQGEENAKVFQGAQKLFQLGKAPVGIMTFGDAAYMGVPWEVIITSYSEHLGDRRFDSIAAYHDDLVRFMEANSAMFPPEHQQAKFEHVAGKIWTEAYAEGLEWDTDEDDPPELRIDRALVARLKADHPRWEDHPRLRCTDDAFADALLADNHSMLRKLERRVFEDAELSDEVSTGLQTTLKYLLTRRCDAVDQSNLVIGGYGEGSIFPTLVTSRVGPMFGGRVRIVPELHVQIGTDSDSLVMPIAQGDAIDMLMSGIHPRLRESLPGLLPEECGRKKKRKSKSGKSLSPRQVFETRLNAEIRDSHSNPFMEQVAGLPRPELGRLAQSLVEWNIFHARWSAGRQSVLGPVAVAVISKVAGFSWG